MPIHCIVEQVVVSGGGGEKAPPSTTTEVDMDTYAILPSSTLFNEIIRVAMTKLGYSVVEAMGAKGEYFFIFFLNSFINFSIYIEIFQCCLYLLATIGAHAVQGSFQCPFFVAAAGTRTRQWQCQHGVPTP